MTTPQENKLSMYLAVRDYLATRTAVTAALPAFAAGVTRFNTALTSLQTEVLGRDASTEGTTQDKAAKKETMARLAGDMASLIGGYALVENNPVIAAAADVTYSDVLRERDASAPDLAQRIHQLATDHAADLDDYGVTAAGITALAEAITAFRAVIGAPRVIIAAGTASTEEIEAAFTRVDNELAILDRLSPFFRNSQPAFFMGYESARVIVDHAATRPGEPAPAPTT